MLDELSTDKPKPPAMRFNLVPLLPTRHSSRRRTFSQSLQCAWPCGVEKILYLNLKISVFYIFSGERTARCVGSHPHHQRRDFSLDASHIDIETKCFSLSLHTDTAGKSVRGFLVLWLSWGWKIVLRPNREEGAKKNPRLSFMMSDCWNFSTVRAISRWPTTVYTRRPPNNVAS